MSDEPAFASHLRIVLEGTDPTGERVAGILAQAPHAEVVLDPTGEVTTEQDRLTPRPAAAGGTTDATDPALAALRKQIVDPVVAALLSAEEVDAVTVLRGAEPLSDDVWLRLVACGEPFEHLLYSPVGGAGQLEPATVARNLAWSLEDFIAESRFAWGEQRVAVHDVRAHDQDEV